MREIKFRAWCEGKHDNMTFSQKHMDYNIVIDNGKYASVESGWDIHGTYSSIPLMQYTGLKDKNGVEIYEGDIVQWKFEDELCSHEVRYYPGTFCFEMEENAFPVNEYEQMRLEVIGNIYQNPELLK